MAKKKGRPKGKQEPAWEKELRQEIEKKVGSEIKFRKVGDGLYEVTRIVKPTVKNRWAERVQRIIGVQVVGTEDVIMGQEMKQTITFKFKKGPTAHTPRVFIRRATDKDVVRREPNWYTRATEKAEKFTPYYLRQGRSLYEPLDN